jgi:hypothetical protein
MKTSTFQVVAAALVAVWAMTGCKAEKDAKAAAAAKAEPSDSTAALSPDTVVATWGEGEKVTYAQLNDRLKGPLAALERQAYALRSKGLEGMVTESLVQAEAKKQNLSEDAYLKAEIDAKVKQPTEVEIKTVFAKSQDKLPKGTSYETIKPKIVEFLLNREKAQRAQELFAKLREDAHAKFLLPKPPEPKAPAAVAASATAPAAAAAAAHPAPAGATAATPPAGH